MKQTTVLVILIAMCVTIIASTAEAVSNAAVLYLRVAAGARPAGMGEAFVAIADDATATYWNPAGLGNAPLAGRLEINSVPPRFGEIIDVVTMKAHNENTETWAIAGEHLLKFDGKTWNSGKYYVTSSDQNLHDFLQTILEVEDEEKLKNMSRKVVGANCAVTAEEVKSFVETTGENIPEGYKEADELRRGLDSLQSGFEMCLLNVDIFRSLQNKLRDALKEDSVVTTEEMDRITFSLDQATARYLPGRLMVPFETAISGKMTCVGNTGSYLWVGTDNGLYRYSAMSWARYTTDHKLPSNEILDLDNNEERLMIGTSQGLCEYYHGSFNNFPDLPKSPTTAVTFDGPNLGYAVIGNVLHRYDGQKWHGSFTYRVRIDDDLDKIVRRIAVYHTPSEYEYLEARIRTLNANAATMKPAEEAPVDSMAMITPEDTTVAETDTTTVAETAPQEMPSSGIPWLFEGNEIRLPYSPEFRYQVTALYADDVTGMVWVGTESGLLTFNGQTWVRHGYEPFTVPAPDSTGQEVVLTAREIARQRMPMADSARIAALAENIDYYNELNGQPVKSGETIFVYNHNTGSSISAIGDVFGELYVGTEYSLEKWSTGYWLPADVGDLQRRKMVDVYDFDGQAYYVGTGGMGIETKGRREFVMMFVKWLPTLDLDMYYGFASYVHHARGIGTFGISAIYLSYGSITFTDAEGQIIGEENPFEFSLALSYGTSLNSSLKLGGTVKIIHSHLASIGAGKEQGTGIAWAVAVDAGMLLKFTDRMQLGAALTNLGPDISYIDAAQADPLPRNLGVGLAYYLWDTPYNSLVIQGELNKMLTNLNKGIGTELENAIRHIGAEYWYANFLAVRGGYKYDKEGQVKHLTFGAGLQYGTARFDLAYVPSSVDSPLANTLRISFDLAF